jgi:hypothetical protein
MIGSVYLNGWTDLRPVTNRKLDHVEDALRVTHLD